MLFTSSCKAQGCSSLCSNDMHRDCRLACVQGGLWVVGVPQPHPAGACCTPTPPQIPLSLMQLACQLCTGHPHCTLQYTQMHVVLQCHDVILLRLEVDKPHGSSCACCCCRQSIHTRSQSAYQACNKTMQSRSICASSLVCSFRRNAD